MGKNLNGILRVGIDIGPRAQFQRIITFLKTKKAFATKRIFFA